MNKRICPYQFTTNQFGLIVVPSHLPEYRVSGLKIPPAATPFTLADRRETSQFLPPMGRERAGLFARVD
jgi:hypothetical protein